MAGNRLHAGCVIEVLLLVVAVAEERENSALGGKLNMVV